MTLTSSISEYIDLNLQKIASLIPHHFISKSQSNYLKSQKANLAPNSALILMDFSENYAFHVQDEAQGYH